MKKTFNVATIGIPDSQGDVFLPGCFKNKTALLTKNFNHGNLIGKVTLSEDGGKIKASGDIPPQLEFLTPAIGYQVVKSSPNEHGVKTIEEMKLHYVGLCESGNHDKTILPINKQTP